LLINNYDVVGTVRSLKDSKKIEYIYEIIPEKKDRITLVEANLTDA